MKTGSVFVRMGQLLLSCTVVLWISCDSDGKKSDPGTTDLGTGDAVTEVTDQELPEQEITEDLLTDTRELDIQGGDTVDPDSVDVAEETQVDPDVPAPSCGDGICNEEENCETCPGDCGCSTCGETCVEAACVFTACQSRECGDDGCGGTCGTCPEGTICDVSSGTCEEFCDPKPQYYVGDLVQRIHFMDIAKQGHPGDGLDIDFDPNTCAPTVQGCSQGIDNALGRLVDAYSIDMDMTTVYAHAIEDGHFIRLIDAHGWNANSTPFLLRLYQGKAEQPNCNLATDLCEFSVLTESFDMEECTNKETIGNATFDGEALSAGSPEQELTVSIDPGYLLGAYGSGTPEASGVVLSLTMRRVHLRAAVSSQEPNMTWSGVIGGAIPKAEILALVDALPPELELPVSASTLKMTIGAGLIPDVDLDDDGELESVSVGIRFATVSAHIQGSKDLCVGKQCGSNGYGGSCGTCTEGLLCSMSGQCVQPNLVWLPIPGGTFQMGCSPNDPDCWVRENPAHSVTVSSFQMIETEVTESQYQLIVGTSPSCNQGGVGGPSKPVECVTWHEAKLFCEQVGGRLPTEAEWEYAARAGTTTRYYCGDDVSCLADIAWYHPAPGERKQNVKTKDPNAYGLYDMLGNVAEWTSDWYSENYYSVSPSSNPQGPDSGTDRVFRGNSFANPEKPQRVSFRTNWHPDSDGFYLGIRCVRDVN